MSTLTIAYAGRHQRWRRRAGGALPTLTSATATRITSTGRRLTDGKNTGRDFDAFRRAGEQLPEDEGYPRLHGVSLARPAKAT